MPPPLIGSVSRTSTDAQLHELITISGRYADDLWQAIVPSGKVSGKIVVEILEIKDKLVELNRIRQILWLLLDEQKDLPEMSWQLQAARTNLAKLMLGYRNSVALTTYSCYNQNN